MEVLLLIVSMGFGKSTVVKAIVADLVQKVSWSTLVCMGVALGTAASRLRPAMMGLAGLIAAPLAFRLAKVFHKSVAETLSVDLPSGGMPTALTLAMIKAIEYALLGFIIGKLGENSKVGFRGHVLIGLTVGIIFGGSVIVLAVTQSSTTPPIAALVSRAVNEIIFPVGCSIVLYGAQKLGKRINID